jgi:hypothetical protein
MRKLPFVGYTSRTPPFHLLETDDIARLRGLVSDLFPPLSLLTGVVGVCGAQEWGDVTQKRE